jgi:peptidoglycan/xylan/chitin deacetylase (PgdA/CDA1 family)
MNNFQYNFLRVYYFFKPIIPRTIQLRTRKGIAGRIRKSHNADWPINHRAANCPLNWSGWPDNKDFALVLRHDVESPSGFANINKIMDLEQSLGFRSSFNFSPERYAIPENLFNHIRERGFEVGLHGLKHDGKLYSSRKEFLKRSLRINSYLKEWEIKGFYSPSSHHNLEWINELNITYDSSTFDTDPFEPQNDSVDSIFPFIYKQFVELPYTLAQDLTMFIILGETTIDIWKEKAEWIAQKGGMILLNTHPDYMAFNNNVNRKRTYSYRFYEELLHYIKKTYENRYAHFLPLEIAEFWKEREQKRKKNG